MKITVEFDLNEQELEKLRKTAEDMRRSGIEDSENYSIEDEIRFIVSEALAKNTIYERELKIGQYAEGSRRDHARPGADRDGSEGV